MRYQLHDGNVIIADKEFISVNYPSAILLPDVPTLQPVEIKPFDFLRRFTSAERIAARALAATDAHAADFLHVLDSAIASGTMIYANDPDTVVGMAYLSATPAGSPVLAAGRSSEILV